MKLSEAIRLGSMHVPQAFGDYYEDMLDDESGHVVLVGACAIGAALLAVGDSVMGPLAGPIAWDAHFGLALSAVRHQCPVGTCLWRTTPNDGLHTYDIVMHLNDDHRWTREQIATWVEDVEKAVGTVGAAEAAAAIPAHV